MLISKGVNNVSVLALPSRSGETFLPAARAAVDIKSRIPAAFLEASQYLSFSGQEEPFMLT